MKTILTILAVSVLAVACTSTSKNTMAKNSSYSSRLPASECVSVAQNGISPADYLGQMIYDFKGTLERPRNVDLELFCNSTQKIEKAAECAANDSNSSASAAVREEAKALGAKINSVCATIKTSLSQDLDKLEAKTKSF